MKRKVFISGASRGIGAAIVEKLLKQGDYVLICPTRNELDLTSIKSVEAAADMLADVDIIINNAGINILKEVEDFDIEAVQQMLQVNLIAPLKLISLAAKKMKQQNFGRIINISSIWGVSSKEKRTLYSMTKYGINGITKSLSKELGPYNILVNSVCPGFVNTEMTKHNLSSEEQKELAKTIPLRRFAEACEIAEYVEFLISERNTYITGQTLVIDGGFI